MSEKVLRWVVLGGIFALPFIVFYVSRSLFFPFITGKNFAFRVIVEVIAAAWLSLMLVNAAYRPRKSWLLAAIVGFVAVMGVSAMFGVNPSRSFWSNFERMEGWITLAHLLVYFIVAYSVLTTEKMWRRFWNTSLVVSALVGCYGLLQLAGFITINQGGVRLDATFGNATYLAVYMLFHIFIAIMLWLQVRTESQSGRELPISLMYGGVIALDTLILFFTATRGAILGLIGGLLLAGVLYVLAVPNSKSVRRIGIAIVLTVLVSIGVWFARDTALVQNIEPLRRLASISVTETTVSARFVNWSMAWQGIKEKPLLGWGQENYGIVFSKYYDPRMYAQEPWFDRVHNVIFDMLIAGGFVALLAYLSILGVALLLVWRRDVFTVAERSILTGLLAGYFFHNLFVFDNITSYILFFSVLAYIASRAAHARNATPLFSFQLVPASALPVVAAVCVLGLWGTAWAVNADPLKTNKALIQGLSPQTDGGLMKNLEYFEKAVSYGATGQQEAREHLTQTTAQLINAGDSVPNETKQAFLSVAVREMTAQEKAVPQEARFPLFLGLLFDTARLHNDGKAALERALKNSPKKQSILYQLGNNAQARGDAAAMVRYMQTAYELAPANDEARAQYAGALIRVGNDALAEDLLRQLIERGAQPHARVVSAYAERKRYDKVIPLWLGYLANNPQDAQGRFTLAAVYYAAGDNARSIATLEALARDIPSTAAQAQQLIKEVNAGTAKLD